MKKNIATDEKIRKIIEAFKNTRPANYCTHRDGGGDEPSICAHDLPCPKHD